MKGNRTIISSIFLGLTILFTVVGQLLVKKGASNVSYIENWSVSELLGYFTRSLLNIYTISGLLSAVLAALSWLVVVGKMKLSYAYPFMALTFILVPLFAKLFFGEEISCTKWLGIGLIFLGVCLCYK